MSWLEYIARRVYEIGEKLPDRTYFDLQYWSCTKCCTVNLRRDDLTVIDTNTFKAADSASEWFYEIERRYCNG